MPYVVYEVDTKKIISIQQNKPTIGNNKFQVVFTNIDHPYIYIDKDGNVQEYSQEQIEVIKKQELSEAKRRALISLNKYIESIKRDWDLIQIEYLKKQYSLDSIDQAIISKCEDYVKGKLHKNRLLVENDYILLNVVIHNIVEETLSSIIPQIVQNIVYETNKNNVLKHVSILEQYQLKPILAF